MSDPLETRQTVDAYLQRFSGKDWTFASRISKSLEVTETDTDRSAIYDFLLVFHSNRVSKIKSDKCKLSPPRVFNALLRRFVLEFCDGGGALTRSPSSVTIMSTRFDTVTALSRQTDRQTNRQTDRQTDGFVLTISRCACIACWRAIKSKSYHIFHGNKIKGYK